ncbi:zinc ribbon domain-containing protein [Streptomyces xinghaiensis]|uniref:zinc ribbon domain-containing protein n=1 Tax=Streptomyces xinghaiensis TaxID=1038928 RepID=UPI00343BD00B
MKTVGVKREGRRWYVILACDDVPAGPLPPTGSQMGVDLGTVHFLTDSDGHEMANPGFLGEAAGGLAAAQRHLAMLPKRTRHRTEKRRAAARNPTRTCPPVIGGCGHVAKENRVTRAEFACVNCGLVAHAEHVGALNVEHRTGLVLRDGA